MAWIESHQTLKDHPKLARLACLLDVHRTSAAGLLHFLWWWALDHAEDGDLSDFDASDIATGACWEGDPEHFLKALMECGPGARSGFVADVNGKLVLHDWDEYAGKLVARRVRDRERKRADRETSSGRPKDVAGDPGVQNRTEPNQKTRPAKPDVDPPEFVEFWTVYPRREGKGAARKAWAKAVQVADASEIIEGARRYRDKPDRDPAFTAHASTWLNAERWADEATERPRATGQGAPRW